MPLRDGILLPYGCSLCQIMQSVIKLSMACIVEYLETPEFLVIISYFFRISMKAAEPGSDFVRW